MKKQMLCVFLWNKKGMNVSLLLIDDHGVGESTLCGFSIGVDIIVAPDSLVTVLLKFWAAWFAASAASDNHADSDYISYGELAHIWSHFHHLTYHLVPVNKKLHL